mmetsp:Transcript_3522/g.9097  ORF Transcript_3522/g.9097 Transcript_3522/m.9097 type:complete len:210 (+) Transcript_3522:163-792(+)
MQQARAVLIKHVVPGQVLAVCVWRHAINLKEVHPHDVVAETLDFAHVAAACRVDGRHVECGARVHHRHRHVRAQHLRLSHDLRPQPLLEPARVKEERVAVDDRLQRVRAHEQPDQRAREHAVGVGVRDDKSAHVRLQRIAHQRLIELVALRRDHAQATPCILADHEEGACRVGAGAGRVVPAREHARVDGCQVARVRRVAPPDVLRALR